VQLTAQLEDAKREAAGKMGERAEGKRELEEARREAGDAKGALAEERRRFANLLAMRRFVRTQEQSPSDSAGGSVPDAYEGEVGFGPVTAPHS
jgi:hypothetical protein